jgi:hypothetical protein
VVVAIALAVPAFLLAGIFISIGYSIVGWLYIASSREVKRIGEIVRPTPAVLLETTLTRVPARLAL